MIDEVRSACAAVAAEARHVRINDGALSAYQLAEADPPPPDPAHEPWSDPESTAAFVLTLDTINFGSGWFPVLRKRPGLSGYFTIATALREHGLWPASELENITAWDCVHVFGQDVDGPAAELMAHFARALNDLGRFVGGRFGGRFGALVESAGGSAVSLARLLTEMPLFRDVHLYRGRTVPFYKRAQITAADLSLAGVADFSDLDQLTTFADNLVPHVLRVDGVLAYDPSLARRIEAAELIPSGSEEEVEIRACAVHAVEKLSARTGISPMHLDYVLWNRGQGASYKALPRHRTRTIFY